MADVRWSIPLQSHEASLFALEAAVAARDRIATAIRGVGEVWEDTPPLPEMCSTDVFPGAPVVHSGTDDPLETTTHNVCLFTGGTRDVTASVVDVLARYDEVWVPFGLAAAMLRDAGVSVRDVAPPTHEWETTSIPSLPPPIAFCHEEWRGDGRGVQALIRAWLTTSATDETGTLLLSVPDIDAAVLREFITVLRSEAKCPGVDHHRIKVLNAPSPSRLQSCLNASDFVVCSHLDGAGWRWAAAKAIAGKKALISTHVGDVLNQVSACSWVEVSNDMNALTAGLRRAIEGDHVIAHGHDWMSEWSFVDFCETRLLALAKKGE